MSSTCTCINKQLEVSFAKGLRILQEQVWEEVEEVP